MPDRTPSQDGRDLWELLPGLILRTGGNPTRANIIRSVLKDLILEMLEDDRIEGMGGREAVLNLIRDYITGR